MVNPLTRCVEDYSLPPFAQMREADIVPALRTAMAELALDLNAIEDDLSDPDADLTWESVMDRLEIIDDPLNRLWRIVIHLSYVANSPELRAAQVEVQAEVVTIQSRRAQSVEVFQAMNKLRASPQYDTYTVEQQRILERAILAATLSGVALNECDRRRCNQISIRLKELANTFSDNILDGTKAFSHMAYKRSDVEGLPDSILALLAQNAVKAGHPGATAANGPWRLSLELSAYSPVIECCSNRRTRQLMFDAHTHKAAVPPHDNTPIMEEMLRLRHELAQLLGYNSYAEVSLLDKTAPSVSAVEALIFDLRDKCLAISKVEMAEVADFALKHGQEEPLEAFDIAYWSVDTLFFKDGLLTT
ncbi:hypothetical protein H310_11371 [Aphanomyces invadans]|uniref:Uncharacterized protein n=2 Tax=Aphanomyces invadans TaxID=157072 RepID=A0A024TM29_9STRA|nr:hypothetical protein H310_11371 [Aphanomyces invadans]ETV95088.1 hypothetical protein H310_11371 [Aphanomyces invadans]|eukprot:XP_008876261.1 hypothetical protein H310_11371 [Aphanomyces invadans]